MWFKLSKNDKNERNYQINQKEDREHNNLLGMMRVGCLLSNNFQVSSIKDESKVFLEATAVINRQRVQTLF